MNEDIDFTRPYYVVQLWSSDQDAPPSGVDLNTRDRHSTGRPLYLSTCRMPNADVVEYAIRYCVSRLSYAFEDGLDLAEQHWNSLAESTKRDVLYAMQHKNEHADLGRWPTIQAAVRSGAYPKVSD